MGCFTAGSTSSSMSVRQAAEKMILYGHNSLCLGRVNEAHVLTTHLTKTGGYPIHSSPIDPNPMSLVAYDTSSDEEDAGEPAAAAAPSAPPFYSSIGPQPKPSSPSASVAAARQPTPSPPVRTQNVAPASSNNVSLPTPSLDLPDVADLFAPPLQSLQSRASGSSSRDNASRKRESNGSHFQDSQNKFPRTESQPRRARSVAGNSLVPPQLRGRSNVVTEDMSKLFVAKRRE